MERRTFINSMTAASLCALGAAETGRAADEKDKSKTFACKVTVLKKTFQKEFADKYRKGQGQICDRFQEGQEFLIKNPWEAPAGFCSWAWGDIRTMIHLVHAGKFDTFVTCCTDGYRPVFFLIERVTV